MWTPENKKILALKQILAKKNNHLVDSFSRLEKVAELIRTKNSEDLKSLLTLQLQTMRGNMEYISTGGTPFFRNDDQETPQMKLAESCFGDIAQLGVHGLRKKWDEA